MNDLKSSRILFWGAGRRMVRILSYIELDTAFEYQIYDSNPQKAAEFIRKTHVIEDCENFNIGKNDVICVTIANKKSYDCVVDKIKRENKVTEDIFIGYDDIIKFLQDELLKQVAVQCYRKNNIDLAIMHLNGFGIGGIESWIRNLYWGLSKDKEYRICCIVGKINQSEESDLYIDSASFGYTGLENEGKCFFEAIKYIEETLPRYILLTRPNVFLDAALAMKEKYPNRIKLVYTLHGGKVDDFKKVIENEEYFEKIICCSELWTNRMIKLGIDLEKVSRMECPFRCPKELDRKYSEYGTPIRIGWAGRIVKSYEKDEKRLDYLLNVCKNLKNRGVLFVLSIAGDGEGLERFKNDAINLGVSENITFMGRLNSDEMMDFWQQQDICVLTSDSEGRSISLLEGMGCGTVPVVTDVSGVREEVTCGYNGFYVPVGNMDKMEERIVFLYENRDSLPIWGKRSRDIVYPKSSVERHIKYWEELLDI